MDQSAQKVSPTKLKARCSLVQFDLGGVGRREIEPAVRSLGVVVLGVDTQDAFEVSSTAHAPSGFTEEEGTTLGDFTEKTAGTTLFHLAA